MKKIEDIRDYFELDPSYVHLGLAMLAPHPEPVRAAIQRHRKGLDLNPTLYYRNKAVFEDLVLKKAAEYLETVPEQIAVTESTTMGLAVVLSGLKMNPGDEILSTEHEHYAALELLRFKTKREGIHVSQISLYQNPWDAHEIEMVNQVVNGITNRTRLVVLTWVHSSTGVKLPIKQLAEAIDKINAGRPLPERVLLAIDAVHALGIEEINVEQLGCDFLIAGCHKWLFGPRGTGIVWGSKQGWERLIPIMTSFKTEAFFSWYHCKNPETYCPQAWLCTPGGFQAYEHRWALGDAFEFHQGIGKTSIASHIHSLNHYCKKQMMQLPNIKLFTPMRPELSSGMICFDVADKDPGLIVEKLLKHHIIAGQTPYRHSLCRFTPGLLNDTHDIDKAIKGLAAVLE